MPIFSFQVRYYSEWDDKLHIAQGAMCAEDYNHATAKIERRFPDLTCMKLTQLGDEDFIFMNEENFDKFENDISAFDDPDDESEKYNEDEDPNW